VKHGCCYFLKNQIKMDFFKIKMSFDDETDYKS